MSHELRSPLAAASSWIEVPEEGALSAADRAHAIATIGRNLRLQSLPITDLLDVSRIVTGKLIELEFERGAACIALLDRARFGQSGTVVVHLSCASLER